MKKALTTFSIAVSLVLLASCGTQSNSTSDQSDARSAPKGAIRVAGTGVSYPHSFKDGNDLVGFDTEVIKEAAGRAGYSVEFSTMDFPGLLGAISADRIDTTATNLTWTTERANSFVFSSAYGFDGVGIATATSNDALNSLADLNGKTVGAGSGTTNFVATEAWARDNGYDITLRPYDTAQSALQDTLLGRVDAMARPSGSTIAQIKFQGLELKVVGEPITHEQSRFPFADTERGKTLATDISESLTSMGSDGTLKTLSEKYFSYDRSAGADKPEYSVPDPRSITTPDGYAASTKPTASGSQG